MYKFNEGVKNILHTIKKFLILSALFTLTACGMGNEQPKNEASPSVEEEAPQENIEQEEISPEEETEEVVDEPEQTNEVAVEPPAEETPTETLNNEFQWIYDELSGKTFDFSSGVGAWRTGFTFTDNGEFSGTFSDADGSEIAVSEFVGQFDIDEEVDEFTYLLDLTRLEVTSETDKVEQDGEMTITYVAEPHGFPSGSDTFELYLPYKPKSEVSDAYLSWVYGQANNGREFLNTFGLYNVNEEFGMEEFLD